MNSRILTAVFAALAFSSTALAEAPAKTETPVKKVEKEPCSAEKKCAVGQFCEYPEGDCGEKGGQGACTKLAEMCTMIYSPVCGCDAKTYSSACAANGKGQSVRAKGECPKS